MNDKVGPSQLVTRRLQGGRDTANEITPMPSRRTGQLIERQGDLLVVMAGVCFQRPILALSRSNPRIKPDRRRHHKTVVIVRVLADKIDAPGGAKNAGSGSELFPKKHIDAVGGGIRVHNTSNHGFPLRLGFGPQTYVYRDAESYLPDCPAPA